MIFGFSGTKRTVRNREVSVRRGYTVLENMETATKTTGSLEPPPPRNNISTF